MAAASATPTPEVRRRRRGRRFDASPDAAQHRAAVAPPAAAGRRAAAPRLERKHLPLSAAAAPPAGPQSNAPPPLRHRQAEAHHPVFGNAACVLAILRHLEGLSTLAAAAGVCTLWRDVAAADAPWRALYLRRRRGAPAPLAERLGSHRLQLQREARLMAVGDAPLVPLKEAFGHDGAYDAATRRLVVLDRAAQTLAVHDCSALGQPGGPDSGLPPPLQRFDVASGAPLLRAPAGAQLPPAAGAGAVALSASPSDSSRSSCSSSCRSRCTSRRACRCRAPRTWAPRARRRSRPAPGRRVGRRRRRRRGCSPLSQRRRRRRRRRCRRRRAAAARGDGAAL
jgi:hypothetical protein